MIDAPQGSDEPELPAMFQDAKEQREFNCAVKFLEDPPPGFLRWLKSHKVDIKELKPRTDTRSAIYNRVRQQKKHWHWMELRKSLRDQMRTLKLPGLGADTRVELSLWLMEPILQGFKPQPKPIPVTEEDLAGMEFLPDFMRWVALHPNLGIKQDDDCEQSRFLAKKYEKAFPCPNQTAQTMLNTYRGDKKMLDAFFRDCLKRHFEDMKAGVADPESVASKEHSRIDSLEGVLGRTKPVLS